MGRRGARLTHAGLSVLGFALYLVFVIPRWWVLTGDIPGTLATVGRIVAGFPIAAAAVPVALSVQRSIKDQAVVPELALRLRAWSGVLHLVAGVLIVLTAVAEIWLSAPAAAPWLFAVYGAAAALAILGIGAFVLSFVAEKPPLPPKPAKAKAEKPKKEKKTRTRRTRGKKGATADEAAADADDEVVETEESDADVDVLADDDAAAPANEAETVVEEVVAVEDVATETPAAEPTVEVVEAAVEAPETPAETVETAEPAPALLNKRPEGKRRHRLRR